MKGNPAVTTLVLTLGTLLGLSGTLFAQTEAVARISYSEGLVSIQPGGNGEWVKSAPGDIVRLADNVWADRDSRADLDIDGTAVRIDSQTSLTLEQLSAERLQLKLWLGSIILANGAERNRTIAVETPNLTFTLDKSGEYRLDVNSAGDETVAEVWNGKGEATGGGARYFIHAGQRAELSGTDDLQLALGPIFAADDFDQWAFSRDQVAKNSHTGESNEASAGSTGNAPSDGTDQDGGPVQTASGPPQPGLVVLGCAKPWCELDAYPELWGLPGIGVWCPTVWCELGAGGGFVHPSTANVALNLPQNRRAVGNASVHPSSSANHLASIYPPSGSTQIDRAHVSQQRAGTQSQAYHSSQRLDTSRGRANAPQASPASHNQTLSPPPAEHRGAGPAVSPPAVNHPAAGSKY